jgi:hypothetical protein
MGLGVCWAGCVLRLGTATLTHTWDQHPLCPGPPLRPAAPPSMCTCSYFLSHLFLGELRQVAVYHCVFLAVTLYTSWAFPMDCLSYSRQLCCAQGAQQDRLVSSCP